MAKYTNRERFKSDFIGSILAESMDTFDKTVIVRLNSYMAKSIYYTNNYYDSSKSRYTMSNKINYNVYIPINFRMNLKENIKNINQKKLGINAINVWFVKIITKESTAIFSSFFGYLEINRAILEGKKFRKSKD